MIYVDNAAEAHVQAADALETSAAVAGRAYFISQGEPVNCWQWMNQILRFAGIPPVKKRISFKAAWRLGASLESLFRVARIHREPPMTRFLAAQLATSHYFDIRRARRAAILAAHFDGNRHAPTGGGIWQRVSRRTRKQRPPRLSTTVTSSPMRERGGIPPAADSRSWCGHSGRRN